MWPHVMGACCVTWPPESMPCPQLLMRLVRLTCSYLQPETQNPTWNAELKLAVGVPTMSDALVLSLFDQDFLAADDFIGDVVYSFREAPDPFPDPDLHLENQNHWTFIVACPVACVRAPCWGTPVGCDGSLGLAACCPHTNPNPIPTSLTQP